MPFMIQRLDTDEIIFSEIKTLNEAKTQAQKIRDMWLLGKDVHFLVRECTDVWTTQTIGDILD